MKAAVCYGKEDIRIEETKVRGLGPNDVLVKIAYCGICPSDLRVYSGKSSLKYPIILGHEFTGWIEDKGIGVNNMEIGTRVVVDPCDRCYTACEPCRRGYTNKCRSVTSGYEGFAEYYVTSSMYVHPLKDSTDMIAASLTEPLACVIHGQKQAKVVPGSTVLIVGAGPIGLLHVMVSKFFGAKVISSDISDDRLQVASKFGADITINPLNRDLSEVVMEETEGWAADSIIIAAGKPEIIEQTVGLIGIGGTMVIFAGIYPETPIRLSPNLIHYQEINITGSSDYTDMDFIQSLKMIEEGHIDTKALVTDVLDLKDIGRGMSLVRSGNRLKVVIKISE